MTTATILVVDDEEGIRQMLKFALEGTGFNFSEAANAEQAQAIIEQRHPALILMDWMLPGISGVDLARRLKRQPATRDIPIIMLTAKGEEADKVKGLDFGADDYVTKPFSTRELIARIKAVLRRADQQPTANSITAVDLVLDTETHRVTAAGRPLDLSPTEFRLLHFFISHPERVFSRSQLLDQVWGNNIFIEERTVDVHIRRLRKALEPHGYARMIQTVRSVGYRFSSSD